MDNMGMFETRIQRREYQIWKDYAFSVSTDYIAVCPTASDAMLIIHSFGGLGLQKDCNGPYTLQLRDTWVTDEETN